MGTEKGLALAQQLENIEALFIYGKKDGSMETVMTENFGKMLRKNY